MHFHCTYLTSNNYGIFDYYLNTNRDSLNQTANRKKRKLQRRQVKIGNGILGTIQRKSAVFFRVTIFLENTICPILWFCRFHICHLRILHAPGAAWCNPIPITIYKRLKPCSSVPS